VSCPPEVDAEEPRSGSPEDVGYLPRQPRARPAPPTPELVLEDVRQEPEGWVAVLRRRDGRAVFLERNPTEEAARAKAAREIAAAGGSR
jgi:hypothetical protein